MSTFLTAVAGYEDSFPSDQEDATPRRKKKSARKEIPPEDGEQLIRLQKRAIERMTRENEQLREEVVILSKCHKESQNKTDAEIAKGLMNHTDYYTKQLEIEKRHNDELGKQLKVLNARFEDMKIKSGSAGVKPDAQVRKHIRILEDRLDRAIIRFNDALGVNKHLRENIDNLRRERASFEEVVERVTKELHKKKEEIASHTEITNVAYEARDLARARIRQMQMERDLERRGLKEEFNLIDAELANLTEEGARIKVEMEHAGGMNQDEEAAMKKKHLQQHLGRVADMAHLEDESSQVRTFQEAFQQIKEATGVADVNELVTCFIDAEDENFSLFNFMNELHAEASKVEEQIAGYRRELEEFQGTSGDSQRKSLLKTLESRLASTEEKARTYEQKAEHGSNMVKEIILLIERIYKNVDAKQELTQQQHVDMGSHGVTESNMMVYLGLVEQRLAALLRMQRSGEGDERVPSPKHKGVSSRIEQVSTMDAPAPVAVMRAAEGVTAVLGGGPASPARRLKEAHVAVEPPAIRDDSGSGGSDDDEDEERPLTTDELKAKTLRGLERRTNKPLNRRDKKGQKGDSRGRKA